MNHFPSRLPGLLAISIGLDILMGTVFYALSFHVFSRTPLLAIGTFLILLGALLNPMWVGMFHHNFHGELPGLSQFIVVTGIVGSLILLIGSGFDFLNTIVGHNLIILYPLSQTQSMIAVGYAFLGIWLVSLNVQARLHHLWPRRIGALGIVAGTMMMMALLAIPRILIPYFSLVHIIVPELGELAGNLGWRLFYPGWSIWIGFDFWKDHYESPRRQVLGR